MEAIGWSDRPAEMKKHREQNVGREESRLTDDERVRYIKTIMCDLTKGWGLKFSDGVLLRTAEEFSIRMAPAESDSPTLGEIVLQRRALFDTFAETHKRRIASAKAHADRHAEHLGNALAPILAPEHGDLLASLDPANWRFHDAHSVVSSVGVDRDWVVVAAVRPLVKAQELALQRVGTSVHEVCSRLS